MEVSLAEAARRLGLTTEAVRKRAARGSLQSRRAGRRLLIILPDDAPEADRPATDHDQPRPDDAGALIAAQQAEIAYLRDALQRAQEADAEQRRIIAALVARVPELAAPAADARAATTDQRPAARRPWWRFWR